MRWLLGVALWLVGCCGSPALGRRCLDPSAGDGGGGVRVDSPALECPSRLCLVAGHEGGATAVCTVECSSDGDCDTMGNVFCAAGYACASVAGYPRPVCVCRRPGG